MNHEEGNMEQVREMKADTTKAWFERARDSGKERNTEGGNEKHGGVRGTWTEKDLNTNDSHIQATQGRDQDTRVT